MGFWIMQELFFKKCTLSFQMFSTLINRVMKKVTIFDAEIN